jgi:electron transfer flavoprotein alpha subunit
MTHIHDVTNEQHRAECGECKQLWAELDAISAEAAQLPMLAPSRDLWSGIEARIGGAVTAVPASSAPTHATPLHSASRWYRSQAFRLAMAASLLVAATSAVTWRIATAPSASVATATATADATTDATEESAVHLASFSASVSQMDHEIATLQQIVTERRGGLDPKTVAVLETNLALIDAAIAESRAALDADPASQFLAAQFARAYTSKLTLLRDAATLPVGI